MCENHNYIAYECLSMNVLTGGELLRVRLEINAGKNVTCVRITAI